MNPIRIFSILLTLVLSSSSLLANTTTIVDFSWDVGGSGAEVAANGDQYLIGTDMSITTTNKTTWDTSQGILELDNNKNIGGISSYGSITDVSGSNQHILNYSSGQNRGDADYSGFTNNFSWGKLIVDWVAPNPPSLPIDRRNELNMTGGALYVYALTLGNGILGTLGSGNALTQIAGFSGSGTIYYDAYNTSNAYLLSGTYFFGSGGGKVVPVKPPLYPAWKTANSVTSDTADPDRDGVPNLLEYALGTDPNSAASVARPVAGTAAGKLTLTFTRARTDVTYIIQGSSDLSTWTTISTNPSSVGQRVTVSDTVSISTANPPRRFMRLKVTNP